MAFRDYSNTPASNTLLADGTYIGPNMLRNKVRPALQQIAADGKALADETTNALAVIEDFGAAGLAGLTVPTTSRATMAVLGTSAPAFLKEAGREGLFVFSTANHSANVTRDPGQGIYVPPTGDSTGASGAWVRQLDGPYNVKWWGAKGDASYLGVGTDDTAAIQAALDYLDDRVAGQNRGGELYFPRGHYKCASTLDLSQMTAITLSGQSAPAAGYTAPPPSQLVFTGTGAGKFLNMDSTVGCTLRDLGIRYTSGSYTGSLISCLTLTGDTAYLLVERCHVGGQDVATSTRLIDLHGAILCSVVDCHIGWGVAGIAGRKKPTIDYSNAHYIARCTFDNLTDTALLNAGEGWAIVSCWFEGTDGGTGGMPYAYHDDLDVGSITSGLSFHGCWFGDAVNVADAWINPNNTALWGFTVSGGLLATWDTLIPVIKLPIACQGVNITGTSIGSRIDLGSADHSGVEISGNYIYNGVINLSDNASNVQIVANAKEGGVGTTVIRIGTSGAAATASTVMDFGGSYSGTPGANPKIAIFKAGDAIFGIGASASQFDLSVTSGAKFGFLVAETPVAYIDVSGIDLPTGKNLRVNGTQVVGAQGAAVADAVGAAGAPTQAEFNALKDQLNALLARVRAHGLIAT